jgi:1-acyl-sn-glycerol-3-phosphate acyltransferase
VEIVPTKKPTEMIKAKHNSLYFWFFWTYYEWISKIHFRKRTIISQAVVPENHSVLLFQNHFSWWDGYWSYFLSRKVFKRKFYVMMDEDNLRKHMFLNRVGVFSVQKGNRDLLNSLNYTSELLNNPKNLVTIYPTGVMTTQHYQAFQFQKGIDRILKNDLENHSIVLAVFLVDYFGFARPEIRIYLEIYSGERSGQAIQAAYHTFYQDCITKQTE